MCVPLFSECHIQQFESGKLWVDKCSTILVGNLMGTWKEPPTGVSPWQQWYHCSIFSTQKRSWYDWMPSGYIIMNISLSPLVDLVISANKKGNQTYATEVLTYFGEADNIGTNLCKSQNRWKQSSQRNKQTNNHEQQWMSSVIQKKS